MAWLTFHIVIVLSFSLCLGWISAGSTSNYRWVHILRFLHIFPLVKGIFNLCSFASCNHNSCKKYGKLNLIFFTGVEFALHEMEVEGKKVNFFLKWLLTCKPCEKTTNKVVSLLVMITTLHLQIGKLQKMWNLNQFKFYILARSEESSGRESMTGLSHKSLWG